MTELLIVAGLIAFVEVVEVVGIIGLVLAVELGLVIELEEVVGMVG